MLLNTFVLQSLKRVETWLQLICQVFLQTEQDGEEEILIKLTGAVALLIVESDEEKWKKHVVQENGKCTIYVHCNKALYGTMNAAL